MGDPADPLDFRLSRVGVTRSLSWRPGAAHWYGAQPMTSGQFDFGPAAPSVNASALACRILVQEGDLTVDLRVCHLAPGRSAGYVVDPETRGLNGEPGC